MSEALGVIPVRHGSLVSTDAVGTGVSVGLGEVQHLPLVLTWPPQNCPVSSIAWHVALETAFPSPAGWDCLQFRALQVECGGTFLYMFSHFGGINAQEVTSLKCQSVACTGGEICHTDGKLEER